MRKPKTVRPFKYKGISDQEAINLINEEFPISLIYNEELVDLVCQKYPFLDKTQIVMIIKATFEGFRELLMLGKILNFNNLFFDAKLVVFAFRWNGITYPASKLRGKTAPELKYL